MGVGIRWVVQKNEAFYSTNLTKLRSGRVGKDVSLKQSSWFKSSRADSY